MDALKEKEWSEMLGLMRRIEKDLHQLLGDKKSARLTVSQACNRLGITRGVFDMYERDGILPVKREKRKRYIKRYVLRDDVDKLLYNGTT